MSINYMTFLSHYNMTSQFYLYICHIIIRHSVSFRKLKILSKFQRREWNHVTVPELKLEGKWLEKLGFEIGGEVIVKQQKGKLTITPK